MPSNHPDGDPFIRNHWRALIASAVLVVGLASACGSSGAPEQTTATSGSRLGGTGIFFIHDDERNVGCWTVWGSGISCLADKEYR